MFVRGCARQDVGMSNYRRVWVPGGTYFFTVNLLDRRQRLLVEHVDALRDAFGQTRAQRPSKYWPSSSCPTICIACGACLRATPTTPLAGDASRRDSPARCPPAKAAARAGA